MTSDRRIPFLQIGVVLMVLATLAIPADWRLLAAEPVFPFLQEGSARTAYVAGAYESCLKKQRPTPQAGPYCLCFGRALADAINSREYGAVISADEAFS